MPHTILVVEDDPDIGQALCRVLGEAGHTPLLATDGRKALAQLRQPPLMVPCLILLDMMMPVMDGRQFLVERQRDAVLATVPLIVMTAGPVEGLPASLPVLRKPLRLPNLLRELDMHCSCARSVAHP